MGVCAWFRSLVNSTDRLTRIPFSIKNGHPFYRDKPMNGISRTAGNMAAVRALETVKPEAERLFSDRYAIRFLRPTEQVLASAAHVPAIRRMLEAYFDGRAPG